MTTPAYDSAVYPRDRHVDDLSGPEPLLVILGGRFCRTHELLGRWLARHLLAPEAPAAIETSEAPTTSDGPGPREPTTLYAHVLDPDPATGAEAYWSAVLDAINRSRSDAHRPGAPVAGRTAPARAPRGGAFARVCAALGRLDSPAVLVLDAVHLLPDGPAQVRALFHHAPPWGLRVIASSHDIPGWHAPDARVAGARFVDADDLTYSLDDVRALLSAWSIDADDRVPDLVLCETGGLPDVVRAACTRVPAAAFGSARQVAEHIRTAVDGHVREHVVADPGLSRFGLRVSLAAAADSLDRRVLDLLDARVADRSAPDTAGSDGIATALRSSGVARGTGVPTDPAMTIPPALRASLLRTATTFYPEALRDLRYDLVDQLLDDGTPVPALRHLAELGDWGRFVTEFTRWIRTIYVRDYQDLIDAHVLALVPPEVVRDDPLLGQLRELFDAHRAPKDTPRPYPRPPRHELGVPADISIAMRAAMLRISGWFADSAATYDRAIEGRVFPHLTRPWDLTTIEREAGGFVDLQAGTSYLLAGRYTDATTALRRAHEAATSPFMVRDAAGKLALAYAVQGYPADAEQWIAAEREAGSLPTVAEARVRTGVEAARTLVALDRLDLDTALRTSIALSSPAETDELWAFALYAHAYTALATGTSANGLRNLHKERTHFGGLRDNGAIAGPMLDAAATDLLLELDQHDAASRAVEESSHPATATARARLQLARLDPASTLAVVEGAVQDLATNPRHLIELAVTGAAAALSLDDRAQATSLLEAAVNSSKTTGIVGPFHVLPAATGDGLRSLGIRLPGPDTAGRAPSTDAASNPGNGTGAKAAAGPSLSARERTILSRLASSATIREVAETEHVSINTVKAQLRSVYRKLGVRTRAEAVDVARSRGLLDEPPDPPDHR